MATYPQAGGHWSVRLQYMLGLKSLGEDFLWLELFRSRDRRQVDERLIRLFLAQFRRYGLETQCAIARYDSTCKTPSFDDLEVFNIEKDRLRQIVERADILWNFHCSMRKPLLSLFSRKVLLDLDPGHLQVSALHWDMDIEEHDVLLTVGTNMHGGDCEAPTLGKTWQPFLPPIFLPLWTADSRPDSDAPFTSVTQWNWGEEEEMWLGDRLLSVGKRDAYLRFVEVPKHCEVPLELAANIDRNDTTGDRETLRSNGWRLVSPHRVAGTPRKYQNYILRSRGEFGCAKPIHAALRTGWFSDRSAAFLASGRPVVIEDTGLSAGLPVGTGILTFSSVDEACDRLRECAANYQTHAKAARAIAEEYLDSSKVLPRLIDISTSC